MEKKIMYTECEPEKKFLWLHTKDNNLVLEVFGNKGWEPVSNEVQEAKVIESLMQEIESIQEAKQTVVNVVLPELTEKSSKKEFISAFNSLKDALVKANIIKI